MQGTPLLIIGHHLLTGKVVQLEKPLAVMVKSSRSPQDQENTLESGRSSGETEYEIIALVKRKILFKNRPKPIITSTLPIKK